MDGNIGEKNIKNKAKRNTRMENTEERIRRYRRGWKGVMFMWLETQREKREVIRQSNISKDNGWDFPPNWQYKNLNRK